MKMKTRKIFDLVHVLSLYHLTLTVAFYMPIRMKNFLSFRFSPFITYNPFMEEEKEEAKKNEIRLSTNKNNKFRYKK